MNATTLVFKRFHTVLLGLLLLSRLALGEISGAKQSVLDWLGQPETVARFGQISDAIWSS